MRPKDAFKFLFTGRLFDAKTAAEWGLINEVVAPEELGITVQQLAGEIASKSCSALRFGKSQFYRQRDMELEQAYAFATEGMAQNLTGDDAIEGIGAFLTKRKPPGAVR